MGLQNNMNDKEAGKAITNMILFIKKEAEDKALEIQKKSEEECTIEKGNILSEARKKMKADYEKKMIDYAIQKKIEKSGALSKTKIKKMAERNNLMENIQAAAAQKIIQLLTKNPEAYKKLLKDLILQGLIKLMEVNVSLRCRKSDLEYVKEVLEDAGKIYIEKITTEIEKLKGKDIKCKLTVDEAHFLPELNIENPGLPSCMGGIQLRAQKDRIVCNNTLDERLELCYQEALPEIRSLLFPKQHQRQSSHNFTYTVLKLSLIHI
eukprot:TRINITY_DN13109_c0_g1_i1.p1 TRINITY_DN13109_c0_g1~~TRINITY_DN13109_c0_g1_i1.p1  ORF type:complete len:299 (-),score=98.79 TRINITY_DN13109_c0_g1_i1:61-855(-)